MDFDTDSQVVSAQKESGRLEAYIVKNPNNLFPYDIKIKNIRKI